MHIPPPLPPQLKNDDQSPLLSSPLSKKNAENNSLKNERGVALILVMFTVVLITYIVTEILYETHVDYTVNANAVNRVKAYYAAKSGLELSLLRIKMFKKVMNQFGAQIPEGQKGILDMIWQLPFSWPPLIPSSAGLEKDLIKEKLKESSMEASYTTTISDEGSKIDINDLGSPSKNLREITKKLLMQIFENLKANDETWARKHDRLNYEEVINNMADWVDGDLEGSGGSSDERAVFSSIKSDPKYPPNRSFRTIEEIRLVPGMNEEIYSQLKDKITVYGTRAINPNHASADLLKALDPSITNEIASKILTRREDQEQGPFKDEASFWSFVNAEGGRVSEETQKSIPLIFSQVTNFRVKSIGEMANTIREIEAVVFDFSSVSETIAARLQTEANKAQGLENQSPPDKTAKNNNQKSSTNEPLPKGPPRVVYFIER